MGTGFPLTGKRGKEPPTGRSRRSHQTEKERPIILPVSGQGGGKGGNGPNRGEGKKKRELLLRGGEERIFTREMWEA